MNSFLELKKISKSFGNKKIYHETSFIFQDGCYAITGPNGAGKSVLIEMLAGVVQQDSGEIKLSNAGDNQSYEYKQQLTFIPGEPCFFPSATGNDYLSFILSVKKRSSEYDRMDKLIKGFNLASHLNSKFGDMSLGTQKKLFLTTLAISNPRLIIMDEPTNALDDESHQLLCETINQLSKDKIVILATHDEKLLNQVNPIIIKLEPSSNTILNKYNLRGHDAGIIL